MPFREDIYVIWSLSPRIIVVQAPSPNPNLPSELTIQDLVDTCRNLEDDIDNMDDPHLINASGKEDLGGGVSVGITAQLQNAKVMFESRTIPLSTGTATSNDPQGLVLTDSGANFITEGIYKGCTIHNDDTDSLTTVTEVIDTTHLRHFLLSGGINSEWTIGDKYLIYPNVTCTLTGGNLVAVDKDGLTMSPIQPSANVQVVMSTSSSATLQDLAALQYASYQNAVWLDPNGSDGGTSYPMGTRQFPVNNISNAISIANAKGFNTIELLDSITINTSQDLSNFTIHGQSLSRTALLLGTLVNTLNMTIKNCDLTGILDGGTQIEDSRVGNLTYVNGGVHRTGLYGTIILDGGLLAIFKDCCDLDPTSLPIIDMNGSGQDLIMQDYSGEILIRNLNGDNTVQIQLDGGHVTLETISAGTVIVTGIGRIMGGVTGTAVLNSSGLISPDTVAEAVWDALTDTYDDVGSFGKKMKTLATKGDVWAK